MSNLAYFAEDGNFGNASNLAIVDVSQWTEEDWERIEMASDYQRSMMAMSITAVYEG